MRRRLWLVVLCVLALIVLVLPLTAGAERRATSKSVMVNVAFNTKLKQRILVTSEGMTLYLWLSDLKNSPTCYDDPDVHCSLVWPPYRTIGPPVAGSGVNAALLGSVNRTDGDPQVTYNGHPLYIDAGAEEHFGIKPDRQPGDVNGQDVFGWYVVSPLGGPVKRAAVSPSLSVRPTSVTRGGKVTVSGRGCIAGDDVFLISPPFVGHAFVPHSVATTTRLPYGSFSRQVRIRTDVRPGRYAITARCGGANLGLAAHLRVH
jgi:predicted lipoprotein with Yx(FWY)xxD motif